MHANSRFIAVLLGFVPVLEPSLTRLWAEEAVAVAELRVFPAPGAPEADRGPLFRPVPADQSGLDFIIPIDLEHPERRLYYSAMACGGVAVGDLDGDGWPELFFSAGPVANRLYRHFGEGGVPRFEDMAAAAGVAEAESWCNGSAMADVDGDGDLDLFVCRYDEPNRLYLNESKPGELRFREAAAEWGLDLADASLMATFSDYDRDGDLDLFLATNALYRKGGRPSGGVPMRKTETGWEVVAPWDRYFEVGSVNPQTGVPTFMETSRPNRLYRNDGARFTDVSASAGLRPVASHTNGAAWMDFDHDGWPDLYVANDFTDRDELYRNRGDGTFAEVAADVLQHTTWFSMGAGTGDYNNDGLTDLIVADMLPTTHYRQKVTMGEMGASFAEMYAEGLPRQNMLSTFFVNTGTGLFFEAAHMAGVAKTDWTWAVKRADFDGDGRLDLYFPTGHTRDFNHSDYKTGTPADRIGKDDFDLFLDRPELREHDLALRGATDWKFEKSGDAWGLGLEKTMNYGAALADLDRDGDVDLVTVPLQDRPTLFLNQTRERGLANHLLVRLKGRGANTHGIGAKVSLVGADGGRQSRDLLPYNGYQESDEPFLHFGLGQSDRVSSLEVIWPSGTRQVLSDLSGNRWIEISEPADSVPLEKEEGKPLFRRVDGFAALAMPEAPFDDFLRQPLLPHQHSQLGPGQAWGDVDGDGQVDLYLGSPKGQPGRLLLNRGLDGEGNPVFALRMRGPFTDMTGHEDMGVLLLDFDGDGDRDLLAVSGSVECEPGDASLADRLYLNDGKGEFTEALGHLPAPADGKHDSGSVAAAADFDRDGDLDVYIGGRVVPGQYPEMPRSRFLINDGAGRFTDATAAQGLASTGLVTGALWSDADGDGWLDLLLTHEWGPVRIFSNREGKLEETTEAAGLAKATGFWNSIAGRDLNGDGHLDYLVGNLGKNTKYSASHEVPELIYYGDVDGSGKRNLVEAKFDRSLNCLLPRRGLSCSSLAMPNLLQKVNTYHGWASSALDEIYEKARLESALKLEATTLESMVLINDGEGRFSLQALPVLAQIAPLYGIALSDFDGDGYSDAVLAQNFFPTQQETGPYDGGLGLLLRGAGSDAPAGGFKEVWPRESGVIVPGDAKSLGIVDFGGEGRPDLVFGMNQAGPVILMNEAGKDAGVPLVVVLEGKRGNLSAIGARVTVEVDGLPKQTAEVAAGSGYLTQNTPELFFGWGAGAKDDATATVTVRWPDGSVSESRVSSGDGPRHTLTAK
jgi:enediyne biosynthesis protein E4